MQLLCLLFSHSLYFSFRFLCFSHFCLFLSPWSMLRACKWYQGAQTILLAPTSKEVVDFCLKIYDHSLSQWRWHQENVGGTPARRTLNIVQTQGYSFNGKKMHRAWELVPLTLKASTLTFNIHSTNISLSICQVFFLGPWDANKNSTPNLMGRERAIKINN